jgi:DNA recombination protein RmuC
VAFVEDLIKVGNGIKKTQTDYEEAMKKLHEGTGNLVRRAEKMKELGAKTSKQLPPTLIERAKE